ncbi:hypothetical protein ACNOYE_01125 [Nannocystaceae bacterium ST9]
MKTSTLTLLLLALGVLGCDSADEGNDESEPITNACGTFDPNEPGDSVIPQDPDDPEILAACSALCDAQLAGIAGCVTTAEACLEHCKLRSCGICPDTLVPLVDCETAMFTGEGCTCTAEGIECPEPAACSELEDQTAACGG